MISDFAQGWVNYAEGKKEGQKVKKKIKKTDLQIAGNTFKKTWQHFDVESTVVVWELGLCGYRSIRHKGVYGQAGQISSGNNQILKFGNTQNNIR